MIGMTIISALAGLLGVLAGILVKAKVIDDIQEDQERHSRTMWQAITRIGDDCDSMWARIYNLERKLKEAEDGIAEETEKEV